MRTAFYTTLFGSVIGDLETPIFSRVKSESRVQKDEMIRDKVLSYMIEHSGRLNASMNVRTKRPITGKKITKNEHEEIMVGVLNIS